MDLQVIRLHLNLNVKVKAKLNFRKLTDNLSLKGYNSINLKEVQKFYRQITQH